MYPLDTVDFLWILLYEVTIFLAVTGILLLIRREGFVEEESAS